MSNTSDTTTDLGAFRSSGKPHRYQLVPEYPDTCGSCGRNDVTFAVLVATAQDQIPEWWCRSCVNSALHRADPVDPPVLPAYALEAAARAVAVSITRDPNVVAKGEWLKHGEAAVRGFLDVTAEQISWCEKHRVSQWSTGACFIGGNEALGGKRITCRIVDKLLVELT